MYRTIPELLNIKEYPYHLVHPGGGSIQRLRFFFEIIDLKKYG